MIFQNPVPTISTYYLSYVEYKAWRRFDPVNVIDVVCLGPFKEVGEVRWGMEG